MTDYVYIPNPLKPHNKLEPLFTLNPFDTLTFTDTGLYRFDSLYAPFAVLGGSNVVVNNAHLWRFGGVAFYGESGNNHIINNTSILGNGGIYLAGSNNRVTNNHDVRVIRDGQEGDALTMIGDQFSITNYGLFNGSLNTGINVSGNYGRIQSYDMGQLEFSGVVIGETTAVFVDGSYNRVDFGTSGKLLTIQVADGRADTDGLGDGLLVGGNSNSITLSYIRAGHRGAAVYGDNNTVQLLKYSGPRTEHNPDTDIMAEVGVSLNGYQNSLTNQANIDAQSAGLHVEGNGFFVMNDGNVRGGDYGAILRGNDGTFLSLGGKLEGSITGLKLTGDNNFVSAVNASSSGSSVDLIGDSNLLNLTNARSTALDVDAVKVTGGHNTLYFLGRTTADGRIVNVKGDNNFVHFGGTGISAMNAVLMKGKFNALEVQGSIDAGMIAVQADGDNARIFNWGSLRGETGITITGTAGWARNFGTLEADNGVIVKGTSARITNEGVIKGTAQALYMLGDQFDISNKGAIEGDMELHGNGGRLESTGSIKGKQTALTYYGQDGEFTLSGAVESEKEILFVEGIDNDFVFKGGTLKTTGSGTAFRITGKSNTVTIADAVTAEGFYGQVAEIEGHDNHFVLQGSADGLIPAQSGIVVKGSENFVRLSGGALATEKTTISIRDKNYLYLTKGAQLISALDKGVEVIASGAEIHGGSGQIEAASYGIHLKGDGNLVVDVKKIVSKSDTAVLVEGDNNELSLLDVETESRSSQALWIDGSGNRMTLNGKVHSPSSITISVSGDGNTFTIGNTAVIGKKDLPTTEPTPVRAFMVNGSNNQIENHGTLYGRIDLLNGTGNAVQNNGNLLGVFAATGAFALANWQTGTIVGNQGVVGEGLSAVTIDNHGMIVGAEGEAIKLGFDTSAVPSAHLTILNHKGAIIASESSDPEAQGAAIRIEGTGQTDLTNFGVINGSVLLGDGQDTVVNEGGEILGRTYRVVSEGGVPSIVLVGLDLGDGENVLKMDDGEGATGFIWGEIWGGADKDVLFAGRGSNVIRGFGGNDSIHGGSGADTIYGGDGEDVLLQAGGNGYLDGGADDDFLWSEIGNNTLAGGSGRDIFVISHAPDDSTKADIILDFVAGTDRITLNRNYFSALNDGIELDRKAFAYADKNIKKDTRIIYDRATGDLYYDADGKGSEHSAIKLAHLEGAPLITADDIGISVFVAPSGFQAISALKGDFYL